MRLRVGTSGYSYKEWCGTFYPEGLKPPQMLGYYAERLGAVEINNTFYRMPKAEVLENWARQVPDDFRFSLKASRRITHFKRLRGVEDELDYLTRTAASLGQRLGPLLFQLPPNFKRDDGRLEGFLRALPDGQRAALEFRNASWFEEEVFDQLRSRGVALVLSDTGAEDDAPLVATGTHGYLRLRRQDYAEGDLEGWIERIREQPWEEVLVFFKHEDEGAGPRMAARFRELWDG